MIHVQGFFWQMDPAIRDIENSQGPITGFDARTMGSHTQHSNGLRRLLLRFSVSINFIRLRKTRGELKWSLGRL